MASLARAQEPSQTVSGRVLDARDRHPLAHATVTLQQTGSRDHILTTITGTDGNYRFEAVPAGRYTLRGEASRHLVSMYLQHEQFGTAIVTGAGLVTEDLTLALSPMAGIAGRILDEAGEPVARASVLLLRDHPPADQPQVFQRKTTGDDGEYEFGRLPAGRYFIAAQARPWYAVYPNLQRNDQNVPYREAIDPQLNVAYPMLFYPAATDETGAEPLELTAGDQVRADMRFQPVPALTLTLHTPAEQSGRRPFPQLTRALFGASEHVQVQSMADQEELQIVGLPPGQYRLIEPQSEGHAAARSKEIDLRSSSLTLEGAAARVEGASVELTIRTETGEPLPQQIHVQLQNSSGEMAGFANPKGKETATIADLAHGEYHLALYAEGHAWHVSTFEVDGKPQLDRTLHIKSAGPLHATVTIANFSAQIDGIAKHGDALAVGTMVVLVPDGPDTSASLFRRDQTDLDGGFSFTGVAPGSYHVVAIDDGWTLRWSDVSSLAKYLPQSEAVTVRGSGPPKIKLPEPVQAQAR
jgi:hypothetical protein